MMHTVCQEELKKGIREVRDHYITNLAWSGGMSASWQMAAQSLRTRLVSMAMMILPSSGLACRPCMPASTLTTSI
jgi:hypothetical protein